MPLVRSLTGLPMYSIRVRLKIPMVWIVVERKKKLVRTVDRARKNDGDVCVDRPRYLLLRCLQRPWGVDQLGYRCRAEIASVGLRIIGDAWPSFLIRCPWQSLVRFVATSRIGIPYL